MSYRFDDFVVRVFKAPIRVLKYLQHQKEIAVAEVEDELLEKAIKEEEEIERSFEENNIPMIPYGTQEPEKTYDKPFNEQKFVDDLYTFAAEYDIYNISVEALHSLTIRLNDVSEYVSAKGKDPAAISTYLTEIYLNAAYDGDYDEQHPVLSVKKKEYEAALKKHQGMSLPSGEPEEYKHTYPKKLSLAKRANNEDMTPSAFLRNFKKSANFSGAHSVAFNEVINTAKINKTPLTEVEFFKALIVRGCQNNFLPKIYRQIGFYKVNSSGNYAAGPDL